MDPSLVEGGGECVSLETALLYRGSRDGYTAAAFHAHCDGKDNTVCVVEDTEGNIFGGFADVAWASEVGRVGSDRSFFFPCRWRQAKKRLLGFHSMEQSTSLLCVLVRICCADLDSICWLVIIATNISSTAVF